MTKVELLAPAGSMEKLKFAILYGADAVYVGIEGYSLRAGAGNFTADTIGDAVSYAHSRNVNVYAAINIFAGNSDFEGIGRLLEKVVSSGVDALIISDPGIFQIVKVEYPEMRVHLSTQANTLNKFAVDFWTALGTKRVTLARELGLADIRSICKAAGIEIEVFIHGAMCISYSGRCHLSKYMVGRDANRGNCAHSCRWKYHLMEEKRPGEYYPVEGDDKGYYFFNSKDLCLAEYIPDLIDSGVRSFKIEGRMKSLYYLSTVVGVYRDIIDRYYEVGGSFRFESRWRDELEKVSHRPYTDGFISAGGESESMEDSKYIRDYDFIGIVESLSGDGSSGIVDVRNRMRVGDEIELLQPGMITSTQRLSSILVDGEPRGVAHANQRVELRFDGDVKIGSLIRKKCEERQVLEIGR